MKQLRIFIFLIIAFNFTACEKETVIVPDNTIPPHNAVSTVQVQNFINKSYIDLIGRKPNSIESDNALTYLFNNDYSNAAKTKIIEDLQASQDYYNWLFQLFKSKYLNAINDGEIQRIKQVLTNLQRQYSPGDPLYSFFQIRIDELQDLQDSATDFYNDEIGINEFVARQTLNQIYDDINMGSENFVLACFENMFNRQPTDSELERGTRMVNGNPEFLFLETGNSKGDFVEIATNAPEFYQGLIVDLHINLLGRNPNSSEIASFLNDFISNQNFKEIQKNIMISEEYASF